MAREGYVYSWVSTFFFLCLLGSVLAGCGQGPAKSAPGFSSDESEDAEIADGAPKTGIIPGRYIVVYKDGAMSPLQMQTLGGPGLEISRTYQGVMSGYAAAISEDRLPDVLGDPRVAYVEPDQYVSLSYFDGVPDLVITGFDATPTSMNFGETITIRVKVSNRGSGISGPFMVSLYGNRDSAPRPGDPESVSRYLPFLFPGTSVVLTFRGYYGTPGTFRMWAAAGSRDFQDELSETNNAAGPLTLVVGGGGDGGSGPDLQVTGLTLTPAVPAPGQTVRAEITVKNVGGGLANPSRLGLYKNLSSTPSSSTPVDVERLIPALSPGQSTTAAIDISYASAGSYSLRVLVDRANEVTEGDEQNNAYGPVPVTVSQGGGGGGSGDQQIPTGIRRIAATESSTRAGDGAGTVDATVAVIDTGIELNNPELNVVFNRSFVQGSSSGNDGQGHGTHVAGTVAARDNGTGVVGVAPGARLWAIKVLDDSGSGTLSSVLAGMDYVASQASQVQVVNISLGGGFSQAINDAAERMVQAGITVVVAAGNEAQDARNVSPASAPNVITVAALADSDGLPGGRGPATRSGADDTLASFSNFGNLIDVIAPGVDILSTVPTRSYQRFSGTSMASPHVAGLAALIKARNPSFSPAQVRQALINASRETISGRGGNYPLIDARSF